jgi:hypothetical protein
MTPLTIIKGDATSPQAKGPKVIAHRSATTPCNAA